MGQGASCLGRPYAVDDAVPTVCAKPLHNVQEEQVWRFSSTRTRDHPPVFGPLWRCHAGLMTHPRRA